MIKKLFITSLFLTFVPALGSAAASAAADVKTRVADVLASDTGGVGVSILMAQTFGIAPATSMHLTPFAMINTSMSTSDETFHSSGVQRVAAVAVPRQFDQARSLIDKGQLGDFFQKYSEWSMSPTERAYILKYFFSVVQPPLDRLQVQELAQMVHWFYRANQFDVLDDLMNALPAAWQAYAPFMEMIKKAADSAEESRAAKRPKIATGPVQAEEDVVMASPVKPQSAVLDVHPYERVQHFMTFYVVQGAQAGFYNPNKKYSPEVREWVKRVQAELVGRMAEEVGLSTFEKRLVYCIVNRRIDMPTDVEQYKNTQKLLATAAQISRDDFPESQKTIISSIIDMPKKYFSPVYQFTADVVTRCYRNQSAQLSEALNFLPKELRRIATDYCRGRRLGISVAEAVQNEDCAKRRRERCEAPWALNLDNMMIASCEGLSDFTDKSDICLERNLLREIPVEDLPQNCKQLHIAHNPGIRFVRNGSETRPAVEIVWATGCGFSDEYVRILKQIFPGLERIKRGSSVAADLEDVDEILRKLDGSNSAAAENTVAALARSDTHYTEDWEWPVDLSHAYEYQYNRSRARNGSQDS